VSRLRFLVLSALFVVAGATGAARAETPIPSPPDRWVTDRAGFLSSAAVGELDARLGDYDRRTGHQVLVYIDHTTGGVPIEDWAVKAFQRWKVGHKGLDDGVALFVFGDDHKLRIEVGYGLEDHVTDALASRIINERIVPRIRAGDNDGAVRSGVDALLAAIGAPPGAPLPSGSGVADNQAPAPRISGWQLVIGAVVLVLLIGFAITHPSLAWLMLMSIGSGRGGGGGGWGGGGGGGGGGGFSGGGGRSGGGGASGSW
jgi:uncharacterized protein